jgi:hypothetical protein
MGSKLIILPDCEITDAREINLDDCARRFFPKGACAAENTLLDPAICQRMVDRAHAEAGCSWSFGGYLENRSHLWRSSYMEDTGGFIHLGVDCNVAAGNRVAAPYDCTVLHIFDDGETPQGWGPRLTVAPADPSLPYLILAHLEPLTLGLGQSISKGEVLSRVAEPPFNGRWFPHLHLQQVRRAWFDSLSADEINNLDGYGHPSQLGTLQDRYPDPTWLVRLT